MDILLDFRPVDDSSINTAIRQLSSFKTEKLLIDKASLKILKECINNKSSKCSLRFSQLNTFNSFLANIILIQSPSLSHSDVVLKRDLQKKEYNSFGNYTLFVSKNDVLKEKWKLPEDSKHLLKEAIKPDRNINDQHLLLISEIKNRHNLFTVYNDFLLPVTTRNFLIEGNTRILPAPDKIEDILSEEISYSEDTNSQKQSSYEENYTNCKIEHKDVLYTFVPLISLSNSTISEPLRNFKKRKLKPTPQVDRKYISRLILGNQQESIYHNKFMVNIPSHLKKENVIKSREGLIFSMADRIFEKRNYSKVKLSLLSWRPFQNLSKDDALEDKYHLDTKQANYPKNENETRECFHKNNFILFKELEKDILLECVSENTSNEQQRQLTGHSHAAESFQKLEQLPKSSELFQVIKTTETFKRGNSILPTEISSLSAIESENKDQTTITEEGHIIHQESKMDTGGIDLDTIIMAKERELADSIFEMDNVVISTVKAEERLESTTIENSDLSKEWLGSFNNTSFTSTDLCFRRIAVNTKFAEKYQLCNSTFLELSGNAGASLSVHEFEYNDSNLEFDLFISSTCSIIIVSAVQTYQVSSETGNLIIIDNLERLSVQVSSLIFVIIDDSESYTEKHVQRFANICESMSILTVISRSDENILFSKLCSLIKEYGEIINYSKGGNDLENDLFYSVC